MPEEEIIIWHDKALETAVKREMNVSFEDDIKVTNANNWTGEFGTHMMMLEGEDIENIEDLKHFTNLRKLVLKNTNMSDLTPLLYMKELDALKIDGGQGITNIDVIGKMKSLVDLSLYNIPLNSIRPLAEMKGLWILELRQIPLDDISPLKFMRSLSNITLEGLQVEDVSDLKYLRNLSQLHLHDFPVQELPLLSDTLELLTLDKTSVSDISTIPDSIRILTLQDNHIVDYSPLRLLTSLTNLYIADTDLSTVKLPLPSQKMNLLSIRDCHLTDLVFWEDRVAVTSLDMQNNELENIKGIERVEGLKTLLLSGNKITGIEGIGTVPGLKSLSLSENPIWDLTPLSEIDSLEWLGLSGINLEDITL